jgi:hypothetical protein
VGAVKVDLSQKERALDAKYPALDSPENLRILYVKKGETDDIHRRLQNGI